MVLLFMNWKSANCGCSSMAFGVVIMLLRTGWGGWQFAFLWKFSIACTSCCKGFTFCCCQAKESNLFMFGVETGFRMLMLLFSDFCWSCEVIDCAFVLTASLLELLGDAGCFLVCCRHFALLFLNHTCSES